MLLPRPSLGFAGHLKGDVVDAGGDRSRHAPAGRGASPSSWAGVFDRASSRPPRPLRMPTWSLHALAECPCWGRGGPGRHRRAFPRTPTRSGKASKGADSRPRWSSAGPPEKVGSSATATWLIHAPRARSSPRTKTGDQGEYRPAAPSRPRRRQREGQDRRTRRSDRTSRGPSPARWSSLLEEGMLLVFSG